MIALTFVAATAVSWLMRVGFILGLPAGQLPEWVRRSFEHAGSAAMAALVVTSLMHGSGGSPSLSWPALVATAVSGYVAWRTHRFGLTVAVGVGVMFTLEWILP